MIKPLRWHMPPLFTCMKFAFCPTEEVWEAEREKVKKADTLDIGEYPQTNGMCVSWRSKGGVLHVLITLDDELDSDPVELISVIAHECYHLACHTLRAASEEEPGEETVAYLVGDLVKTIWEDYCLTRGKAKFPGVAEK